VRGERVEISAVLAAEERRVHTRLTQAQQDLQDAGVVGEECAAGNQLIELELAARKHAVIHAALLLCELDLFHYHLLLWQVESDPLNLRRAGSR
jgi:phosphoribosylaminoimidazole carboxylase (NCAIR synthetase)